MIALAGGAAFGFKISDCRPLVVFRSVVGFGTSTASLRVRQAKWMKGSATADVTHGAFGFDFVLRFAAFAHRLKFPLINLLIQDLGAFQSNGNARTDVACPDMLLKLGLMHQAGGLFARAAED